MGFWLTGISILLLISYTNGQSKDGFISLDCGYDGSTSYTESFTGIDYYPDASYVRGGEKRVASPEKNTTGYHFFYTRLRSFPKGRRNCYTLSPLRNGNKYMVRAEFWYLNFDGKNSPPSFDVYLGVHFWKRVESELPNRLEIIFVSSGDSVQVCLVNTGLGTPYINMLELRPMERSMYYMVNVSSALVLQDERRNFGGEILRFPDDPYDRIWFPPTNESWISLSTNNVIEEDIDFRVPTDVLRTAATTPTLSGSLDFNVSRLPGEKVFVFMYFTEVQEIKKNETRELSIYVDNTTWYTYYRPPYLKADYIHTTEPGDGKMMRFSIKATENSTLPPIINALESHVLVQLNTATTDQNDTNAVTAMRDAYGIAEWEGDPCQPKMFSWEGLTCINSSIQKYRISSLDLSNFGLSGGISKSVSELTALVRLDLSNNNLSGEIPKELQTLKNLQFLDLSNNNLTGEIPSELGLLPNLRELNLMRNGLNGSIPETILLKSQSGALLLRVEGNTQLQFGAASPRRNILPLILGIFIPVASILIISVVAWLFIKRKLCFVHNAPQGSGLKVGNSSGNTHLQVEIQKREFTQESYQLTFAEIVNITSNFTKLIGRGGFAAVYHGHINTETEVAVKMISASASGTKGFLAEAQILSRVHHKNLVSLLGYCNDGNNLVLVYEYMKNGSLRDFLSGNNVLSWTKRLKIALDVAQGLDYLHNFCKPAIIHRDVKSRNILLGENLEAKLGDFGLSRLFVSENATFISTEIAGTNGYLDPEYIKTGVANEKTDVYSYGVLLMEIITGHRPIKVDCGNIPLVSWVNSKVETGDLPAIADKNMQGHYDINSMWKAVELAMECASETPRGRPSMSEVATELRECIRMSGARDTSTSFGMSKSSENIGSGEVSLLSSPSAR